MLKGQKAKKKSLGCAKTSIFISSIFVEYYIDLPNNHRFIIFIEDKIAT